MATYQDFTISVTKSDTFLPPLKDGRKYYIVAATNAHLANQAHVYYKLSGVTNYFSLGRNSSVSFPGAGIPADEIRVAAATSTAAFYYIK